MTGQPCGWGGADFIQGGAGGPHWRRCCVNDWMIRGLYRKAKCTMRQLEIHLAELGATFASF